MIAPVSSRELLQQRREAALLQPLVPANTAILSSCSAPDDPPEQRGKDGA